MRLWGILCTSFLAVASTASAVEGPLNWFFQPTGFNAQHTQFGPQTALALRDRTWPVIFNLDSVGSVQAYALYPVTSPNHTYWHQIGANILSSYSNNNTILSAATSPDGSFGAVIRSDYGNGAAIVGNSRTGFGAPVWATALDFDRQGNVVSGTPSTISVPDLVDISAAANGDMGALSAYGGYYHWSVLLNGWTGGESLATPTAKRSDLALDALGCPHMVMPITSSLTGPLVASDFDVSSGSWKQQTLTNSWAGLPAIAADSSGGVGAAWVEDTGSAVRLMYAYKNGLDAWSVQAVTGNPENVYTAIQKVGLVFDANDFPVISYVAGPENQIWLAYDPVTVPEPSSLALLTVAVLVSGIMARRSRTPRNPTA